MLPSNRNYGMITLDANDEILIRESPTDKEGLFEICTQFNGPRILAMTDRGHGQTDETKLRHIYLLI